MDTLEALRLYVTIAETGSFIEQRRTSLRQCNVSVSGQRELKDGAAERIGARP
jgi:hypothetical protein